MTDDLWTSESVSVTVTGYVAELTLTRPEVDNRMDAALHGDLIEALAAVRANRDLRAMVFASTGRKFAAGADFEFLTGLHDHSDRRYAIIDEGKRLLTGFMDQQIPVVAALHGDAIGLTCTLAMTCDAIVAHPAVRLADPHVLLGLVAGDGGCVVWPSSAGIIRARRHLMTGDPLTAADAVALGIVTDLVATADDVLPAARHLAGRMAAMPPLALQGTKRALNRVLQQRAGEVVDLSFAEEETTLASDDLIEGITAFRERRQGDYRGR